MSTPDVTRHAQVIVIGGGLAGCAAAISIARAGRSVTLIERETEARHKVCGEFLSAEALGYLRALGVDPKVLGAVAIHSVRLMSAASVTTQLPFAAMSVTRKRLDEALLIAAKGAGVNVVSGTAVKTLERYAGPHLKSVMWATQLEDRQTLYASNVFLATGKNDLRGWPRPAGKQAGLIAFKMYWRLAEEQAREVDGHVELVTYRGGYGGLQMVEDGAANLCCLIDPKQYARIGGKWELLLAAMRAQCSQLNARLHDAEAMLEKPLAISHIPYGYVREKAEEGLWTLGDQAVVIPSFTGDGMSIALHSGVLAAKMFVEGKTAAEFQRRVFTQSTRQVRLATIISKAIVSQWQRPLLLVAARLWPGALSAVASATRIGTRDLLV